MLLVLSDGLARTNFHTQQSRLFFVGIVMQLSFYNHKVKTEEALS